MIIRMDCGLIDREALRVFSNRSQALITIHCTPVACDLKTRKLLYRREDVDRLAKIPRRGKVFGQKS